MSVSEQEPEQIHGFIEGDNWFGADPKRTARIAKSILALNAPELSPRDQVNIKKLIRGEQVSRATDPERILKRLNDVIFEQQTEADFNPGNITNRNNLKKHLQEKN